MRLDKYLKVARIVKRRTVAKEMVSNKRVEINGRFAKSSTTVTIGDIIIVHFGNRDLQFEVLKILEHCNKEDTHEMYKVIV